MRDRDRHRVSPFIRVICFRLRATPAAACRPAEAGLALKSSTPRRRCGKARPLPFAHGVGAQRGTTAARGLGRRPFRGCQVSGGGSATDSLYKLGGTENRRQDPCGRVACAMRERRRQWPGVYAASIAAWECIREGLSAEQRVGTPHPFASRIFVLRRALVI